ncbi:RHS repeat domain-containing protein [Asticcacaulis sp. 201]|uniref:RHS repeat domain-containing protein n=1 Tax=Asticcacaulis sp. 201 TaxID=3028787 RepID=UPI0029168413|nr:RHS repeat domain-containing protein [Asticcacaulis sp. 201]MDV6333226.1 RHS repeat domain-containing protein [Asticcacaulis sp. 201]
MKTVSAPGISLQLDYDPEGRLSKLTSSGAVTTFAYDGANLIAEYDGAGNMTKRYMHTLGTDQPWVEFSGSAVGTGNATYLYANYQGSIIAAADGRPAH